MNPRYGYRILQTLLFASAALSARAGDRTAFLLSGTALALTVAVDIWTGGAR